MKKRMIRSLFYVAMSSLFVALIAGLGLPDKAGAESVKLFDRVFTLEGLYMEGSAVINGSVGTNSIQSGAVYLKWSSTINGGVSVGPGVDSPFVVKTENPNTQNVIKGTIGNLSEARSYTMPDFPSFPSDLPQRPDFHTPWVSGEYYEINQDGQYNLIEVTSNRRLVIDLNNGTRILRVKNFDISQGHIVFKNKGENGRLILYVEDRFNIGGSSRFNENGHYNDLYIFFMGSNLNIDNNTRVVGSLFAKSANLTITNSGGITGHMVTGGTNVEVSGAAQANVRVVYAPNARLNVTGSGRIRGAVVAKRIDMSGSGVIDFDDSLDLEFLDFIGLTPGQEPTPTPTPSPSIGNVSFTNSQNRTKVDIIKLNGTLREEDKLIHGQISFELYDDIKGIEFLLSGVSGGLGYSGTATLVAADGKEYPLTLNGNSLIYNGSLPKGTYTLYQDFSVGSGIAVNKTIAIEEIRVNGKSGDESYEAGSPVFLNNSLEILLHDIGIGFAASPATQTFSPVTVGINYDGSTILIKQYRIGENGPWLDYTGDLTLTENAVIYARAGVKNAYGETLFTDEVRYVVDNILPYSKIDIREVNVTKEADNRYVVEVKHSLIDNPAIVLYNLYIDGILKEYTIVSQTATERVIRFTTDRLDIMGYLTGTDNKGNVGGQSNNFLITLGNYEGVDVIGTDISANAEAYMGNRGGAMNTVIFYGDKIICPFSIKLQNVAGKSEVKLELILNNGVNSNKIIPQKFDAATENGKNDYFRLTGTQEGVSVTLSEEFKNKPDTGNQLNHRLEMKEIASPGVFKDINVIDVKFDILLDLNRDPLKGGIERTRSKTDIVMHNSIKLSYVNSEGIFIVLVKDLNPLTVPIYAAPELR